jgi:hypothetical protein
LEGYLGVSRAPPHYAFAAACLELAQGRGLPLATLDEDLRAAAKKENMVLLGVD